MKSLLIFSAIYPCKVQQIRSDGTYGDIGDFSPLTFGIFIIPILESGGDDKLGPNKQPDPH